MKKGYVREIIPPDTERRLFLLKKLTALKGVQHAEVVKRELRQELAVCNGYTRYFYVHRGIKIAIGHGDIPKKYFTLFKDKEIIQPIIRRERERTTYVCETKKCVVSGAGIYIEKIGGVMTKPNVFGQKVKEVRRIRVKAPKTPSTVDPYVGIEIELCSKYDFNTVCEMICDAGLHQSVRIMTDGSLRISDYGYPHLMEICVLTKFSELNDTLLKLKKVISEGFIANDSCGLHVHLDMRHKSCKESFANLASMQMVLYQLVNETRRENRYCHPVNTVSFDEADERDHYAGISKFSFYKHGTIEVRMHHSTTDIVLIEKWVRLLQKIADYRGEKLKMGDLKFELAQLKEKIKPEDEILKYVEERIV